MNENIKKKNVGLILIILLIIVVVAIGTYATLVWISQNNTTLTLRIGQLADVVFVTGDDVNIENMGPVFDYEKDGEVNEFYINNLIDNKMISNVKLNITSISEELKEESFKYVFLSSNDGITYEKVNEDNFSDVIDGTTINLISEHIFLESAYYKLIFYIDGNVNNPIDMQDGSLTGYISADVNIVYGLESQSEITSDTETFLSTSIPRNKIYSINFVADADVSELLADNNVDVLDGTINENSEYPYFDVSQAKDKSIKLYYKEHIDENNVSLYDVIISTESGKTVASSGAYLFSYLSNLKEINLTNLDTSNVTTMYRMFRNSVSLPTVDVGVLDTGNVTNMNGMFSGSDANHFMNLTSIVGLDKIDTSNVIDMTAMFQANGKLTTIDISNFNTSNVTSMQMMFRGCTMLEEIILGKTDGTKYTPIDTSNVTNMVGLFAECTSLKEINLKGINTSNVTNMEQMFVRSTSLVKLDLSDFDTSNVTDMSGMFAGASEMALTEIKFSEKFNTSKVTDMDSMFQLCANLSSLDVSNFNTENVKNMTGMFYGCSKLSSLELKNFNTSKVTNMYAMFYNCSSLSTLNLSSFDTAKVTNMDYMFNSCTNLNTIYASNKFITTNVSISSTMFGSCSNLKGGNGTTYSSTHKDKTYARIDTSSTPGYFTEFVEQ